jgi:hypothetical protein
MKPFQKLLENKSFYNQGDLYSIMNKEECTCKVFTLKFYLFYHRNIFYQIAFLFGSLVHRTMRCACSCKYVHIQYSYLSNI